MIDIKGLNKAEVLKALYDGSRIQGMGFLQAVPEGTVTVEHCQQLLDSTGYPYFDYLYGRVLKVDLSKDEFDERLYDRDNYPGAAAKIIDRLKRKTGSTPTAGFVRLDLTKLKIQFSTTPHHEPYSVDVRFGDIESVNFMIRELERLRTQMEGGIWV